MCALEYWTQTCIKMYEFDLNCINYTFEQKIASLFDWNKKANWRNQM